MFDEILQFVTDHSGEFFLGIPGAILCLTLVLKLLRWGIQWNKARREARQPFILKQSTADDLKKLRELIDETGVIIARLKSQ